MVAQVPATAAAGSPTQTALGSWGSVATIGAAPQPVPAYAPAPAVRVAGALQAVAASVGCLVLGHRARIERRARLGVDRMEDAGAREGDRPEAESKPLVPRRTSPRRVGSAAASGLARLVTRTQSRVTESPVGMHG